MSEQRREPLAAQARRLTQQGEWQQAADKLCQLIGEVTGVQAQSLHINRDQYSLNSLNGRVTLADARTLFFKYHHEEGEEHTIEEYYRAELLREHGFLVDVPVYACGEPGRQILLYNLRDEQRLADVCYALEQRADWQAIGPVVQAQCQADSDILRHTLPTLQQSDVASVSAEAIHQLFWNRLITPGLTPGLGGRVASFYVGKTFQLGEIRLPWETLSTLKWRINGVDYADSLQALFMTAAEVLSPQALSQHGVVVAHGDAHNANVWYDTQQAAPRLISFDPAFAGSHIPALLAEIKATFHNIFAHPCWLYEPDEAAQRYHVSVRRVEDVIEIEHDWTLTPLRQAFLTSKGERYWQPLLAELNHRGWLPENWQQIMRLALFCCPTLVLNLCVGEKSSHNPLSSALGFAIAIMLGSAGDDDFSRWLNGLLPEAS